MANAALNPRGAIRLLAKALALFVTINALFAALNPVPALGRLSLYNAVFPGRERLPYGDVPAKAYNLSLFDLNAMFASHVLAGRPKPADEFRVLLIGDSSTWGWFLDNEQTLAGQINALDLKAPDGRAVRAYNVGYPIMSLTKDLLMLNRVMRYQPDLIMWLVTLESFPADKQLTHPIVLNNAAEVRELNARYGLRSDPNNPGFVDPNVLERTFVGQRRGLADWLRLQLYGALWGATGVDQYVPEAWEPAQRDLEADATFHTLQPPVLREDDLAFDVLDAGQRMAREAGVPMVIVNEPILISPGANSDVRYNFFYPRWAYDQYRDMLRTRAEAGGWTLIDAWDAVPQEEFTNSAVHLTPQGSRVLADFLASALAGLGQAPSR